METNRQSAKDALLETINSLEAKAPTVEFDAPVTLNAITPHMQTFETTFGREVS